MKKMNTSILPAMAFAICLLSLPRQADAAIVITAVESGGDVVFSSFGGTLNLGGLIFDAQDDYNTRMRSGGTKAFLWLGAPGASIAVDNYNTIAGPLVFGSGTTVTPDAGSGGLYGIDMTSSNPLLSVPRGYVSGENLDPASMTFSSTTFSALGLTAGNFVWSWGDGDGVNGDTLSLAVVPEPSSTLLIGLGVACFSLLRRRQRI